EGEKVTSGNYENGKKVGKWLFWNDDTLKEVNYENSQISSVVEKDKNSKIVY
ncbi:MAG: nicotinic acid mononucleotide adenyltransferase, partial [Flavobacteriaceae bacterium CG17_big_fil_post_rev_8_21_14_2_50_33_15]